MQDWRNEEGLMVNVYTCGTCLMLTTTVDVDEGVTPFSISCKECNEPLAFATSNMYPEARPIPDHIPEPTKEFYKPESIAVLLAGEIEHVELGGLLMRDRTDAKIVKRRTE